MKNKYLITLIITAGTILNSFSQQIDKNFHIYLCFGQSNMEGHARVETDTNLPVNKRVKLLQAVSCDNLQRKQGDWYNAMPPLVRCNTGLGPADYFGRAMANSLPDSITIGIINVAVGGCKIELFHKKYSESYIANAPDWMLNALKAYDNNPYQRLVEMAKIAQQSGVIKGILLHQGESNTGDTSWPQKVKDVYADLIQDLNLNPSKVPLLAGEVVHADQNGVCAGMNEIIGQ
ncbi:sialate O-acetylesterase, partial [Pseudoxanthomonas sp. SGD-10]